jgi:hypothetical protein
MSLLTCMWSEKRQRRSFGWSRYGWKAATASAVRRSDVSKDWWRETQVCYRGHGMSTSGHEPAPAVAQSVIAGADDLVVDLADGRTVTVPLAWFSRLAHGTTPERAIGALSVAARGSTGRTWMKTSASPASWQVAGPVRRRTRCAGGSNGGNRPPERRPVCRMRIGFADAQHPPALAG